MFLILQGFFDLEQSVGPGGWNPTKAFSSELAFSPLSKDMPDISGVDFKALKAYEHD